jgi:2-keto-4-pentenoate hydratase/2-oxohepta-3-ene-1,7-dioic acid hydratase in catechol pathway
LDDWENGVDALPFRLDIDGKTVQESNTSLMHFKPDDIIEYVSRYITLRMGDLIFTGTPSGIGNIAINNHLQGYLGERKLLDFYIR